MSDISARKELLDNWAALKITTGNRKKNKPKCPAAIDNLIKQAFDDTEQSLALETFHNYKYNHRIDGMTLLQVYEIIKRDMGMKKAQTKHLPKKSRKRELTTQERPPENEAKCSICLDLLRAQKLKLTLECNHEFHRRCLLEWLKYNDTCPVCRKLAVVDDFPTLSQVI